MNEVLEAVKANPRVLREVLKLPELAAMGSSFVEQNAIRNIEREVFARRQFYSNSRRTRYYRYLSDIQRHLLRMERDYMVNRPALRGRALYAEIARVYSGMKGLNVTARQVRDELGLASEILIQIEHGHYVLHKASELMDMIA